MERELATSGELADTGRAVKPVYELVILKQTEGESEGIVAVRGRQICRMPLLTEQPGFLCFLFLQIP